MSLPSKEATFQDREPGVIMVADPQWSISLSTLARNPATSAPQPSCLMTLAPAPQFSMDLHNFSKLMTALERGTELLREQQ